MNAKSTTVEPEAEPALARAEHVEHPTLAAALAAFQSELPTIKKDNKAEVKSEKGAYSYQYADLADISPIVLPLLGKHGLSWSTRPTLTKGAFLLKYALKHESGEVERGVYPLPAATTAPQQLGSAITYARRYALCAVTGVAPGGDDDDAASAPSAPARSRGSRQQRQQPAPDAPPQDVAIATRDWLTEADALKDRKQLRALYNEAETAGELGAKVHADDTETVKDAFWRIRNGLPEETAEWADTKPEPSEWVAGTEKPVEGDDTEQPLTDEERAAMEADLAAKEVAQELSEEEAARVKAFGLDTPEEKENTDG